MRSAAAGARGHRPAGANQEDRPDADLSDEASDDFELAFLQAPLAMALADGGLRITVANRHLGELLGTAAGALVGVDLAALASPVGAAAGTPQRFALMAAKVLRLGGRATLEHRFASAAGPGGWARSHLSRIDVPGRPPRVMCVMEDITSDQQVLEAHRREAELDPLTGLLNRRGGDRRLHAALQRMAETGPVAVIVCDVDRFKEVNDTYGHPAGDDVLAGLAGRFCSVLRRGDDVARRGGDEFIVVARVAGWEEAAAIADRMVRTASHPWRGEGGPRQVTISAGVAVAHPGRPVEAANLIRDADRALYRAKAAGGGRWHGDDLAVTRNLISADGPG